MKRCPAARTANPAAKGGAKRARPRAAEEEPVQGPVLHMFGQKKESRAWLTSSPFLATSKPDIPCLKEYRAIFQPFSLHMFGQKKKYANCMAYIMHSVTLLLPSSHCPLPSHKQTFCCLLLKWSEPKKYPKSKDVVFCNSCLCFVAFSPGHLDCRYSSLAS